MHTRVSTLANQRCHINYKAVNGGIVDNRAVKIISKFNSFFVYSKSCLLQFASSDYQCATEEYSTTTNCTFKRRHNLISRKLVAGGGCIEYRHRHHHHHFSCQSQQPHYSNNNITRTNFSLFNHQVVFLPVLNCVRYFWKMTTPPPPATPSSPHKLTNGLLDLNGMQLDHDDDYSPLPVNTILNNSNSHKLGGGGHWDMVPIFNPTFVLVLDKLTRYDYELRQNPTLTHDQLERELARRGSDLGQLKVKHQEHVEYVGKIKEELNRRKVAFEVVNRLNFSDDLINRADVILTAGGDGTFLTAASKVRNCKKPVIGINTDPVSSEGYLCLTKKLPWDKLPEAFDRLFTGNFKWLYRQRMRVTMSGKSAFEPPVELHNLQLMYPEYRWSEAVREQEEDQHSLGQWLRLRASSLGQQDTPLSAQSTFDLKAVNTLPYLALNDVFVGESLSSRVSYYEVAVDDGRFFKQKSSGITVCTGTGSTSWYFNINKLTRHAVADLLKIMNEEYGTKYDSNDRKLTGNLCQKFNNRLVYSPSEHTMAYAIRDPVFNSTFPQMLPRGFADKVTLKSRCYDAHLVIDGGMSYVFNHGSKAVLEMREEDALKTVVFR